MFEWRPSPAPAWEEAMMENCHKSVLSFDERSQLFPLKWKIPSPGGKGSDPGVPGHGRQGPAIPNKIPTSLKLVSTSFINFFSEIFLKVWDILRILSTNLDLQGISLLCGKSILNCSGSENIQIFSVKEKNDTGKPDLEPVHNIFTVLLFSLILKLLSTH